MNQKWYWEVRTTIDGRMFRTAGHAANEAEARTLSNREADQIQVLDMGEVQNIEIERRPL